MDTLRNRLRELLETKIKLDTEDLISEIIDITSNPSGLNFDEIEKLKEEDYNNEIYSVFKDSLVPVDLLHKAVNYGLNYGLESIHKGFVPKGNVHQWLYSKLNTDYPLYDKILLKNVMKDITKCVEYKADNIGLDDYDRDEYKNLENEKEDLYNLMNNLSHFKA